MKTQPGDLDNKKCDRSCLHDDCQKAKETTWVLRSVSSLFWIPVRSLAGFNFAADMRWKKLMRTVDLFIKFKPESEGLSFEGPVATC